MGGSPARVLRHYLPVLIGAGCIALLVFLAPTVAPQAATTRQASSATGPTYPAGDAPNNAGVAASGVTCGHNARQVTWSKYAPYCQPAFQGDNGGATSPGVTGTTITVTFRYAATAAEVALLQEEAPGTLATVQQAVALEQAYIDLFNKDYDLYGRHVVLKTFTGQGDALSELSGTGQAGAEADAATAKSLGAFADSSATLFNTQPYNNALAAQHIISVGGLFAAASELQAEAPYEYFPGPDCQKTATSSAALIGRSLVGLPAIFAGSPAFTHETRTFALISPDNDIYASCGQAVVNDLAKDYGLHLKDWIKYNISLDALQNAAAESVNTVTQLKSAGATTVLCGCDPITPGFLAADANSQDYYPEWLTLDFGDIFSQLASKSSPTQWDHSLAGGIATVPFDQQEAVQAYRLAVGNPTVSPPASYQYIYEPLLLLFDGLQAAGPDLTPQTFQAGLDSLPDSLPGGQFGPWAFGPGTVDPAAGFQVLRWDSSALSLQNGKPGTGLLCNGGAFYYYASNADTLPDHRQLDCPSVP